MPQQKRKQAGKGKGKVTQKKKKKGKAADTRNKQFDIACFYMGQGDCSMIRCPDGRIVMVDCGSKSGFDETSAKIVAELVRHPKWAGGNKNCINALILTHKDKDHYSQVPNLLGESTIDNTAYDKLKISTIYFSWAASDQSPLGRYGTNSLNTRVYRGDFETAEIYDVTICGATGNFYTQWKDDDSFAEAVEVSGSTEQAITGKRYTILNGTAGGKAWSVSIIAGNVEKVDSFSDMGDGETYQDKATEDNSRSLITLLDFDGKKALFCGDATFSTERFLVQTQSALISDLKFLLAPHHGSELASSGPFVDATDPNRVTVSSEYQEHSHLHPRKTSIDRWLLKTEGRTTHVIEHWDKDQDQAADLLKNWKKGKLTLEGESTNFVKLANIPDANAYYAIKRQVGNSGVLYREETDKYLEETAMLEPVKGKPSEPKFLNYQIGG